MADYLAVGEAEVRRYLGSPASEEGRGFAEAVARSRAAVVRVRVEYGRTGTSFQTDHASGVVVDSGRYVWTTGHALTHVKDTDDYEILVARTDGRTVHAKPVSWTSSGDVADLALLEIVDGRESPRSAPSTMEVVRPGSIVAILGYPARMGSNAAGVVVGDDNAKNNPLSPLTFIGRVRAGTTLVLEPVAGCIPEGGMSGGPVIDGNGTVVGVLGSVSRHQTGEDVTYTVNATPLRTLKEVYERNSDEADDRPARTSHRCRSGDAGQG
jgi:S1-C subfamily serine protease